jgi:hypothetical protein
MILKGSPFKKLSIQELAEQIMSKSKCRNKLPTWFGAKRIYFPKPISIEQTSSEIAAQYKSDLISGNTLLDVTGGFGVDSYYFSKKMQRVIHCEIDPELSDIAAYNFQILGADNISCINGDGIEFLKTSSVNFDWIYVDPSRRSDHKGKVFLIEDCIPDVPGNLDLIMGRTKRLILKLSPVLDIQAAIGSMKFVKEIHVIAIRNEVKELLLLLEKNNTEQIMIRTVNIKKDGKDHFESIYRAVESSQIALPQKYLYEPNSAILKAGLFNEVSKQLNVYKIHNNSHLYTSKKLKTFPGRSFLIEGVYKYSPKEIKRKLALKKANITIRNFQESVAQIRKRTGIKEGGEDYLFFTTDASNRAIVIHCKKV